MGKDIQHHGKRDSQLEPPHIISSKSSGKPVKNLPVLINGNEVPDALLSEIRYFLEHMKEMSEEAQMKKCYELIRKINRKVPNKLPADDES